MFFMISLQFSHHTLSIAIIHQNINCTIFIYIYIYVCIYIMKWGLPILGWPLTRLGQPDRILLGAVSLVASTLQVGNWLRVFKRI